jgi:hypothetical protein
MPAHQSISYNRPLDSQSAHRGINSNYGKGITMIQLDSISNLALSVEDVMALDRTRVSDPRRFQDLAKGIHLAEDFLLNDRWAQFPKSTHPTYAFDLVMQEMLPTAYSAAWLEKLGGHFGLRITNVGDYTMMAVQRRVVTLSGLPRDMKTNEEVVDLEISPDIFMAFCRGLILDVAEDVLDEDEFEDREISGVELMLHGMPSGGKALPFVSTEMLIRQEKHAWADNSIAMIQTYLSTGDGSFFRGKVNANLNSPGLDSRLFSGNNTRLGVGDFNGDGKADILRQEYGDWSLDRIATMQIYFGKGDGSFSRAKTDVNDNAPGLYDYNVDKYDKFSGDNSKIITGDFNGDGKTDLMYHKLYRPELPGKIATLQAKATTSIYYSRGDGSFYTGRTNAYANIPGLDYRDYGVDDLYFDGGAVNLSAADFDGDGKADLLRQEFGDSSTDNQQTVQVFLNNGNGTFRRGPMDSNFNARGLSLMEMSGNSVTLMAADFNNDGKADILRQEFSHAANVDDKFTIQIFNGRGDGTFKLGATDSLGNAPGLEGTTFNGNYTKLQLGDYNSDGYTDILRQEADTWANDNEHMMQVWINNKDGSFSRGPVDGHGNAKGLPAVDFNGSYTDIMSTRTEVSTSYYMSGTGKVGGNGTPGVTSQRLGCGAKAVLCGDAASAGDFNCGALASSCATNRFYSGQVGYFAGVGAYACGRNSGAVLFMGGCGADAMGCGANGTVSVIGGCGGNATLCAVRGAVSLFNFCGSNRTGCGVKASFAILEACGGNKALCGVNASLMPIDLCAVNASLCTAKVNFPCSAYAVACVVDFGWGADVGACLINMSPLPSC